MPFVVVELHRPGTIYALLDFDRKCAMVFRVGQPLGSVGFADRADSLLGMVRTALPRDTLLQELVLAKGGRPDPARGSADDSVSVEKLPEVLSQVAPLYPMVARTKDIEGTVVILALVGRDGVVKDAFVATSIPKLDDAALDAVWQWKFKPAISGGEPIATWVGVPVKFILD